MLTPDVVRYEHGLKICEKIIPDSAVWNRDITTGGYTYKKGSQYKANLLLSYGTGICKGITVHNTSRVTTAANTTCAEQYTRATYPNCNMGTVRVHYYVDETCAWQNLRENEVGWHATDGNYGNGNNSTISIEIIMGGNTSNNDKQSEKNGALLVACLLKRHNLTIKDVYKHQDWYAKKYCPCYIIPHWQDFLNMVQSYLDSFDVVTDGLDYKTAYNDLKNKYEDALKYETYYNDLKVKYENALKRENEYKDLKVKYDKIKEICNS